MVSRPAEASLLSVAASLYRWALMSVCMQWFGDLVTPEWWGEVWLKEGLASYFEALGATAANPNLAVLDTFYGDKVSKALDADARNSSNHPLVNPEGMLLHVSSWHLGTVCAVMNLTLSFGC
jgi:hypothetical protein